MSNTIELLEAIGKDATLRHVSGEELAQVLAGLQASECLERAALSGDSGHLAEEFGLRRTQISNQVNQALLPDEEEDVEENDEDGEDGTEAPKQ